MDEEIERLVVSVRADTAGFAQDVADMKGQLDGPFASGLERAGSALESTLRRAIRRGSLEFEDMRRVALSVMNDIAGAAINGGLSSLFGGGSGSSGGGLLNIGTSLLSAFLGAPGRATGGPVSGGRAYMVGERGGAYRAAGFCQCRTQHPVDHQYFRQWPEQRPGPDAPVQSASGAGGAQCAEREGRLIWVSG